MLSYILKKTGLRRDKVQKADNRAKATRQKTEGKYQELRATEQAEQSNKSDDMSVATEKQTPTPVAEDQPEPVGLRVSGKQWKVQKQPLRVKAIGTKKKKWDEKRRQQLELQAIKAQEKEMKERKEQERKEKIDKIKEKRAQKEERERYELLAKKMHAKRVERLRRREKRNKLLKER
ncbi:hypothetical protein TRVA0_026S00320 [Trichomonascus vanleenenianus]|uniref:CGR1 family protein n=1 Tax=Trichomonascus vanleenenianus TaxID=2268995 RepID=UPI003ECBA654